MRHQLDVLHIGIPPRAMFYVIFRTFLFIFFFFYYSAVCLSALYILNALPRRSYLSFVLAAAMVRRHIANRFGWPLVHCTAVSHAVCLFSIHIRSKTISICIFIVFCNALLDLREDRVFVCCLCVTCRALCGWLLLLLHDIWWFGSGVWWLRIVRAATSSSTLLTAASSLSLRRRWVFVVVLMLTFIRVRLCGWTSDSERVSTSGDGIPLHFDFTMAYEALYGPRQKANRYWSDAVFFFGVQHGFDRAAQEDCKSVRWVERCCTNASRVMMMVRK